jgi:Protein of unknown function (DUF2899).
MDLHTIITILKQTLIITTFVLGMMMVIEYINTQTRGLWSKKLQKSPWIQILLGAIMGVIPGCLGTFTMVSLYVHRVVTFPAMVTTMIATTGDESFFMFSLFPKDALLITSILFVLSIMVGFILQFTVKNKFIGLKNEVGFPLHHDDECHHHNGTKIIAENLHYLTFTRALLIIGCISVLLLVISGVLDGTHELNDLMGGSAAELHEHIHEGADGHGHEHGGEADWIRITLIVVFSVILYIVFTAKEHFLQEHLWEHVIKVHLPKIFLWTLGVIVALTILNHYVDMNTWITNNQFITLLIAILLGIIPQSGPNLIFVILFANGSLPISILLASSAVQNGHGSLPLLAESRKAFFAEKGANILLGLIIGLGGIIFHF